MSQRAKATLRVIVWTLILAILGILYIPFTFCGLHTELWAEQWDLILVLTIFYAFVIPIAWALIWIHQDGKPSDVSEEERDPYMIKLDTTRQYVQIIIIAVSILLQAILEGLRKGLA